MSESRHAEITPERPFGGILSPPSRSKSRHAASRSLWDALRARWGRSRTAAPRLGPEFRAWCVRVQQLIGPDRVETRTWSDLYIGGTTPLEAARCIVLGRRAEGGGDAP